MVIQVAAGGNESGQIGHPMKNMKRTTQPQPAIANKQGGETLVGMLVGLGVGMVVLAAGSQMLAQQMQGHRLALQDSHVHHDLRSALDTVVRELRQAQ